MFNDISMDIGFFSPETEAFKTVLVDSSAALGIGSTASSFLEMKGAYLLLTEIDAFGNSNTDVFDTDGWKYGLDEMIKSCNFSFTEDMLKEISEEKIEQCKNESFERKNVIPSELTETIDTEEVLLTGAQKP